jgi:hypothetical protein
LDSRDMSRVLQRINRLSTQSRNHLTNDPDSLERYRQYYERAGYATTPKFVPRKDSHVVLVNPKTLKEAISEYPSERAPGKSGVTAEMIKPLGDLVAAPLATGLCSQIVPIVRCLLLVATLQAKGCHIPSSSQMHDRIALKISMKHHFDYE